MGEVPGRAAFSQRSERATACAIRMQIDKQINAQDELVKAKQNKFQITNYKLQIQEGCRENRETEANMHTSPRCYGVFTRNEMARLNVNSRRSRGAIECILVTR